MPTIPHYMQGKDIALMSVTPQTPDATTGVLTAGTAFDTKALGIFDTMTLDADNGLFEVSPTGALIVNYQDAKADFTLTLTTLDKGGKKNPVINQFYNGSKYIMVTGTASIGGSTAANFVIYAIMATCTTSFEEQAHRTTIVARPCGIAPSVTIPS